MYDQGHAVQEGTWRDRYRCPPIYIWCITLVGCSEKECYHVGRSIQSHQIDVRTGQAQSPHPIGVLQQCTTPRTDDIGIFIPKTSLTRRAHEHVYGGTRLDFVFGLLSQAQ